VHNSNRPAGENLRAMILTGLFAALGIVFQRFSISMPLMRIGIGPIPTIVSGMLLGPVYGGITGLIKDVVGFLLAPPASGGFFPPVTVIQMLYGILPTLFLPLFRRPVDWLWGNLYPPSGNQGKGRRWLAGLPARLVTCFLVVILTQFITGGLLMPAALNLLYDGQVTWTLWLARFTTRIPQQVAYFIGYPLVTYVVIEALERAPVWRGLPRQTVLSRHF
jgi:ECF transporter S component (folate family)